MVSSVGNCQNVKYVQNVNNKNIGNKQNFGQNIQNPIKQPCDTFISSKKKTTVKEGMSSNTKFALVLGIGALIGAGIYIITKGKIKKPFQITPPKQLSECIDFKPAQNIDEAVNFAKTKLGIKDYQIDNLDVANYLNEGFVNANNKMKGKAYLPDIVKWDDCLKQEANNSILMAAGRYKGKNHFYVNKEIYGNIDEYIKKRIGFKNNNLIFGEESLAIVRSNYGDDFVKFGNDFFSNKLSYNEKVKLAQMIRSSSDAYKYCVHGHEDELYQTYIKCGGKEIKDFAQKTIEEKRKVISTIIMKNPNFLTIKFTSNLSEFRTIYHELGHLHRANVIEPIYLETMCRPKDNTETVGKLTKEFLEDQKSQEIASKISNYAKSAPEEFCAEVYARLMNGDKLSSDVMELYKKYGGPILD